jgi:hypothetical protein
MSWPVNENLFKMKTPFGLTAMLVGLLASTINAGTRFSDRVLERYARPEKFSLPRQTRSLEERQASFKFLTDATQRGYTQHCHDKDIL